LALFAPEALAWGLQTHVFLAQWLLAAAPFADPQIRAAVRRLPGLVLAGACLPDLALAGRALGLAAFRRAHQWSTLRRLAAACWDEERAIAVGYASHLLADVVAHNRFVPEHERRIAERAAAPPLPVSGRAWPRVGFAEIVAVLALVAATVATVAAWWH